MFEAFFVLGTGVPYNLSYFKHTLTVFIDNKWIN